MRKIEYLSPSSIAKWKKNKNEFYLSYLSDIRAPKFPQTQPMSIGSAFDAYVKSFLHERIFGKDNDSRFNLLTLFEAQVESQHRDWAWQNGKYVFECYQRSGCLADLLLELEASVGAPRFEIEVRGIVSQELGSVTFLGKPDLFYINRHGCHVLLDFKVNGYCGDYNTSPKPGYLRIRGAGASGAPHKDCLPSPFQGTLINQAMFLEDIDETWAQQLSIYGWLCGLSVGDQFITAIDQIVAKPSKTGGKPDLRIAEHRTRVKDTFQHKIYADSLELWNTIHSDHIFRELSFEDSKAQCANLDRQADAFKNPKTEEDAIFNSMMRGT